MAKKRPAAKLRRVPPERRVDVTREEFDRLSVLIVDASATLASMRHDLDIQFTRIAQMQSELEQVMRRVQQAAGAIKP